MGMIKFNLYKVNHTKKKEYINSRYVSRAIKMNAILLQLSKSLSNDTTCKYYFQINKKLESLFQKE